MQAQWLSFLTGCEPSPVLVSAATTLLEGMLGDASYKPHARYVVRPVHHPNATTTWPAVRYR
jgi:hypothetical protein